MSLNNDSGVCSPWLSSGSDYGDVDTPLTEPSLLLNEGDIENAVHQHILVVGGLGFIGSHTCWELAKAGYNVSIHSCESEALKIPLTHQSLVGSHHRQSQQRL
jgi:UDP-glucose 4-epimerase